MQQKDSYLVECGERLRKARKEAHIKQKDFAKMLRVSTGTLQQWEYGTSRPTPANMSRIASVLCVNASDIYVGINSLQNAVTDGLYDDVFREWVDSKARKSDEAKDYARTCLRMLAASIEKYLEDSQEV